jgi:hypothetical protein
VGVRRVGAHGIASSRVVKQGGSATAQDAGAGVGGCVARRYLVITGVWVRAARGRTCVALLLPGARGLEWWQVRAWCARINKQSAVLQEGAII